MPRYQVLNPTDVTIDVVVENMAGTEKDKISIQPRGRPKLRDGWRVSKESQMLNPQIKIGELPETTG